MVSSESHASNQRQGLQTDFQGRQPKFENCLVRCSKVAVFGAQKKKLEKKIKIELYQSPSPE